jgi:diguanylate cyclase (GGDEF)-like protein
MTLSELLSRRRLPLRLKLLVIGLASVLLSLLVVQAAVTGLNSADRSHRAIEELTRAQRHHQDTSTLLGALRGSALATALLDGDRGGESAEHILEDVTGDAARFRERLTDLASMDLGAPLDGSLASLRVLQEAFIDRVERFVQAAVADSRATPAALRSFEGAFHDLEERHDALTDQLSDAADQRRAEAARDAGRTRTRVVASAAAAVAGLLLLALMLDRVGGSLAAVVAELRAGTDRQRFASELAEALDGVDSEAEAFGVIERAMGHAAGGRPMELLLADSSEAQVQRVAISRAGGAAGCPVESPWSCLAVRRGTPLTFPTSEALNACPKLREHDTAPLSATCVPVTFMGRSLGVLHATGLDGDPPASAEVVHLTTLAGQAGSRLGTLRAFERSELQATTDGLTGLINRRTVESRARVLLQSHRTFSLVMADLDHFKRLNDTYGHAAGDRALRLFAHTVRAGIRAEDLFARYGGEEFVLVFPGATVAETAESLERLRAALALATGTSGGPAFTASFGVADTTAGATLDEIVQAADGALLRAKELGRDRVVIAGAEEDGRHRRPSGAVAATPAG